MSGESIRRRRADEDTDLGFLGHVTSQVVDEPERDLDDRKKRETGPERGPVQPEVYDQRREKKRDRKEAKQADL